MASELQVDELKGVTADGDITVTVNSSTMKMQNGLVRCWLDATYGHTTADSFNISSISDDGSAINTYSFTNDFSAEHYGMSVALGAGGGNNGADSRIKAEAAGSTQVQTTYNDSTLYQWQFQKYMWIGDLA